MCSAASPDQKCTSTKSVNLLIFFPFFIFCYLLSAFTSSYSSFFVPASPPLFLLKIPDWRAASVSLFPKLTFAPIVFYACPQVFVPLPISHDQSTFVSLSSPASLIPLPYLPLPSFTHSVTYQHTRGLARSLKIEERYRLCTNPTLQFINSLFLLLIIMIILMLFMYDV